MNYVDWDKENPDEGRDSIINLSPEEWKEYQKGWTKEDYQNYERNLASLPIMQTMMGKDYERYFNDEQDPEEMAERAEAKRDEQRETEWATKVEKWMEKHA
jgi:hypothetical protein